MNDIEPVFEAIERIERLQRVDANFVAILATLSTGRCSLSVIQSYITLECRQFASERKLPS